LCVDRLVSGLASTAEDAAEYATQNLLPDFPTNRASHAAGGTLGGAFQHAFTATAAWAGATGQDFAEAAEQAAARAFLRGGGGLSGLWGGFAVGAVAPVGVVEDAIGGRFFRRKILHGGYF